MNKRIFNYLKCSIKKIYALSMFCFLSVNLNGQIVDMNVLNAQAAYANALREMSLRAAEIRREVHPQRELMYQKYKDGYYRDVVEICLGVIDKYIYYKYDNKAISDMEVLAGDCAVKISAYDTAIYLYKTAKEAGEGNLDQNYYKFLIRK